MIEYLTSIFVIPCSIFDIYPPLEDSLFQSFFSRFDWTLAASGGAHMKLHKIQGYLDRSYWLVGVASGHDYPGNRG